MNSKQVMNHAADNIRILAASMVEKAKSGHPGGAMGGADFINVFCRIIQIGDDLRQPFRIKCAVQQIAFRAV